MGDEISTNQTIFPSDYLVLSHNGNLYRVGQELVSHDYSEPLHFDYDEWSDILMQYKQFGAGVLITKRGISPKDIVVIEYYKHGKVQRNWFLRMEFSWSKGIGSGHKCGDRFLWQIPHPACMSMVVALKDHQRRFASQTPTLIDKTTCFPTSTIFEPEAHENTECTGLITTTTSWKFQLALMCFRHSPLPTYPNNDLGRIKTNSLSFARPKRFQSKGCKFFQSIADDLSDMILEKVAESLVRGGRGADTLALMSLRRVNRAFRDKIDGAALAWAEDAYQTLDETLHGGCVKKLQDVGQSLMQAGVNPCTMYNRWTKREWEREDAEAAENDEQSEYEEPPITMATFVHWKFRLKKEPLISKKKSTFSKPARFLHPEGRWAAI